MSSQVFQDYHRRQRRHPLFDAQFYLRNNPDVAAAGVIPLNHFLAGRNNQWRDPHPLFNIDYYARQVPEVIAAGINPLVHYLSCGATQGKDPHPLFDTTYYFENNPDIDPVTANPLVHYLLRGATEGRDPHPLFDTSYYLNGLDRDDSASAEDVNPLVRFLDRGAIEGVDPHPLFDVSYYLEQCPRVAADAVNPLLHFVTVGGAELRSPHVLFDTEFYARQLPESVIGSLNPLIHFLTCGASEGKDPHPLFDTSYYLENNPDIDPGTVNPLIHYLLNGGNEGRDPHPLFSTSHYRVNSPEGEIFDDIPLVRFLRRSHVENVDPHPLFDISYYVATNPDVAARGINPLLHFLASGATESRNPHPLVDLTHLYAKTPSMKDSGANPLVQYLAPSGPNSLSPHPLFDGARFLDEGHQARDEGRDVLVSFLDQARTRRLGLGKHMGLFDFLACHVGLENTWYSPQELLDGLRNGCGDARVVKPVMSALDDTFRLLLFRQPDASEIVYHLAHFYNKCASRAQRRRAIEDGSISSHLGVRPFKTSLDPVNRCNLQCLMCYYKHHAYSKQPRREMSAVEFQTLAESLFPYSSQVFLSFGFEPLCHSRFDHILELASGYGVPFLAMTTNALLFTESLIESTINAGLNRLYISVDAATESTYARIRKGGSFKHLIKNIKAINDAKKRAGTEIPRLCLNFVLMQSNIGELVDFIRLAKQLDVDMVEAVHLVPFSYAGVEARNESLWHHQDLCNRVLDEARRTAQDCGVEVRFPKQFSGSALGQEEGGTPQFRPTGGGAGKPYHAALSALPFQPAHGMKVSCQWPWQFVGIDPYGNVSPCGWWHWAEPMGNLFSESFDSIWTNRAYQTLRESLSRGPLPQVCTMCPATGSGDVNNPQAFRVR